MQEIAVWEDFMKGLELKESKKSQKHWGEIFFKGT